MSRLAASNLLNLNDQRIKDQKIRFSIMIMTIPDFTLTITAMFPRWAENYENQKSI